MLDLSPKISSNPALCQLQAFPQGRVRDSKILPVLQCQLMGHAGGFSLFLPVWVCSRDWEAILQAGGVEVGQTQLKQTRSRGLPMQL